jgi:hypothetical protein
LGNANKTIPAGKEVEPICILVEPEISYQYIHRWKDTRIAAEGYPRGGTGAPMLQVAWGGDFPMNHLQQLCCTAPCLNLSGINEVPAYFT